MDEYYCRSCGYNGKTPFYSDLGGVLYPSHDICPCCFAQAGYDDSAYYREEWLKSGAKFHEEELKPSNWSYERALQQLKNIPEEYL